MRTGTFFQMARGRAMVRKRNMTRARHIRRSIDLLIQGFDFQARNGLGWDAFSSCRTTDAAVDLLKMDLGFAVRRARQANKDWRRYRQLSKELD